MLYIDNCTREANLYYELLLYSISTILYLETELFFLENGSMSQVAVKLSRSYDNTTSLLLNKCR